MKKVAPEPRNAGEREKTLAGSATATWRSSHNRTDTTSIAPSSAAAASSGAACTQSGDCAITARNPLAPTASTTASTSSIAPWRPVDTLRVDSERMRCPSGCSSIPVTRVPPSTLS